MEGSTVSLYRPDLIHKALQVSKTVDIIYLLHQLQDLIQLLHLWAFYHMKTMRKLENL